jgi:hypothetical protein
MHAHPPPPPHPTHKGASYLRKIISRHTSLLNIYSARCPKRPRCTQQLPEMRYD